MKSKRVALIFSSAATLLSAILAWYVHARNVEQSRIFQEVPSSRQVKGEARPQLTRTENVPIPSAESSDVPPQKPARSRSRTTDAINLAIRKRSDTPEGLKGEIAKSRNTILLRYGAFSRQYLPDAEVRDKFWDLVNDGETEQVRRLIGDAPFEKFVEFRNLIPVRAALRDVEAAFALGSPGQTDWVITELTSLLSRTAEGLGGELDEVPFPEQFMSRANPLLSADQMKILDDVQNRRIALRDAYRGVGLRK